jgi:hypothetical protein
MPTLAPRLAAAALTIGAAGSAFAATAGRAAVHDLWIGHLLAAVVVAILAVVLQRSVALAGMLLVATLAYTAARVFGSAVPPEVVAAYGSFYPFHVQATALLLPISVVAAFLAARTAAMGPRAPA